MKLSAIERWSFALILTGYLIILLAISLLLVWEQGVLSADITVIPTPTLSGVRRLYASTTRMASTSQQRAGPIRPVYVTPAEASFVADASFLADFAAAIDGFGFQNYGSRFPEGDLTIAEVRQMFGDQVCAGIQRDTCVPSPAALLWIETMNGYMAHGHCAGFTVLGARIYQGQVAPVSLAPNAATTFEIAQIATVMRQIAKNWSYQVTREILDATVRGTPAEIVGALLQLEQPVDLGILRRQGGGHSLLAFGVLPQGRGIYHILTYDSNWPGIETWVEVDTVANTWQYDMAGPAADQMGSQVWEGDAQTRSLFFIPLTAYDRPVSCPFCKGLPQVAGGSLHSAAPGRAAPDAYIVFALGQTFLQLTNAQGQQLSYTAGQWINDIPGAEMLPLKGVLAGQGVAFLIPPDSNYTVNVESPTSGRPAQLGLLGDRFALVAQNLRLAAGQRGQMSISIAERRAVWTSDGDASPTLKLMLERPEASWLFSLDGIHVQAGQAVTLGLSQDGKQLSIDAARLADQTMRLAAARVDGQGQVGLFASADLTLPGGSAGRADLSNWREQGSVPWWLDLDRDGAIDRLIPLADRPLADLLAAAASPYNWRRDDGRPLVNALLTLLGSTSAYMSQEEKQALLQTAGGIRLDGDEWGKLLFRLGLAEPALADGSLNQWLDNLSLSEHELAALLMELRLDAATLDQLIAGLKLTDARRARLRAELEALAEVEQTLRDLEFNAVPIERLGDVLRQRSLDPSQLGAVLDELELSREELILVLSSLGLTESELDIVFAELDLLLEDQNRIRGVLPSPTPAPTTASGPAAPTATSTAVPPAVAPSPTATPRPTPIPPNRAPTATNDGPYTIAATAPLSVVAPGVLGNDSDPDGNPLAAVLDTPPTHGALSLNADGSFTYISAAGFSGQDRFVYHASDGQAASNQATVTINVSTANHPPIAVADSYDAIVGTPLNIAAPGVLGNDSDPDGNPLTAVLDAGPTIGTLTLNPNGSFTYTPPTSGAAGGTTFSYHASDDLLNSATVQVSIKINPPNQPPVAVADSYTTDEDIPLNVAAPGVVGNDSDPESSPLTAVLVTGPAHGALTLNANGSFTYSPAANWNGDDSFTYSASDGALLSAAVNVQITVKPINDPPTLDAPPALTIQRDSGPQVVPLSGITSGAADETQTLIVTAISTQTNLIPDPTIVYTSPDAAGGLIFETTPGQIGQAGLIVTVSDGSLQISRSFIVTVLPRPGDLDVTFGGGMVQLPANATVVDGLLQPDGRIVVLAEGPGAPEMTVFRYLGDGSLDAGFGSGGIAILSFSNNIVAAALARQGDGKLIVAGSIYQANDDFVTARLNTNGSPDLTWGGSGQVIQSLGPASDLGRDLAIQPDGKIVVVGSHVEVDNRQLALLRYQPNGALDVTWGGSGIIYTDLSGNDEQIEAIAVQPDGKIVVAGYMSPVYNDNIVARYNSDGSLDTSFGSGGVATLDLDALNEHAQAVAIQSDRKIIVAGYAGMRMFIARYHSNGSLDASWNGSGYLLNDAIKRIWAIAIQADGRIVVTGVNSNGYVATARFQGDGSWDVEWNNGNPVIADLEGESQRGCAVMIQGDGQIIVVARGMSSWLIRYIGN